jgi:hypothetical protein
MYGDWTALPPLPICDTASGSIKDDNNHDRVSRGRFPYGMPRRDLTAMIGLSSLLGVYLARLLAL